MKFLGALLLILFVLSAEIYSQHTTVQNILPSDDELLEAYLIGDITYDEYLLLLDIVTNNIHPGNVILRDNIPQNVLEKYIVISPEPDGNQNDYIPKFRFKHSYASYLEEDARSKYQSNFYYQNNNISSEFTIRREFSGRERFLNRSVTLKKISTRLEEVRVGNFYKKFGLGLLINYHGKNVSFSDEINSESVLYPDYGGYNGIYTSWDFNQYRLQTVSSTVRDSEFSFLTNSVSFEKRSGTYQFAFSSAVTGLKNRNSSASETDLKTSLYFSRKKRRLQLETEFVIGKVQNNSQVAVVTENKMYIADTWIELDSWYYSDQYIDLTGAGRTSLLSKQVNLSEIDYNFYSKRTDQKGVELTFSKDLIGKFTGKLSQLYAYRSQDSTELQSYGQVKLVPNQYHIFYYDFSYRQKIRYSISAGSYIKRIHRISAKFHRKKTVTRLSFQYETKTGEEPTVGGMIEVRYKPDNLGLMRLRCNFGEYNLTTKRIDYIYMFVGHDFDLTRYIKLAVKVSHRYQRESSVKVTNQFSISFEGVI